LTSTAGPTPQTRCCGPRVCRWTPTLTSESLAPRGRGCTGLPQAALLHALWPLCRGLDGCPASFLASSCCCWAHSAASEELPLASTPYRALLMLPPSPYPHHHTHTRP
jgi:hypothetical protein